MLHRRKSSFFFSFFSFLPPGIMEVYKLARRIHACVKDNDCGKSCILYGLCNVSWLYYLIVCIIYTYIHTYNVNR